MNFLHITVLQRNNRQDILWPPNCKKKLPGMEKKDGSLSQLEDSLTKHGVDITATINHN